MIELDEGPPKYTANRLREAREYLGLTIQDVAVILGTNVPQVRLYEDGYLRPPEPWEEKLSRLFQRPVGYLRGDPEEPVEISPELDALMEKTKLSQNDRGELLDFVQFLHHRAKERGGDGA